METGIGVGDSVPGNNLRGKETLSRVSISYGVGLRAKNLKINLVYYIDNILIYCGR